MQQKGFLRATRFRGHHAAFALQNKQNHGLQLFCPDSHSPRLLQKLAMPLQPHTPYMFCSFSPEADLLRKTFGKQGIFAFACWYNMRKGFAS
ncbi:hypothetical protein ACFFGT_20205 [Mucilaginibacter angelicae]|uniref:Uncharacterized protein n=1 Tax=Mucilaginibacter angelicae TaxID=869718 RepID=A0ABV6LAT5_9SPHI